MKLSHALLPVLAVLPIVSFATRTTAPGAVKNELSFYLRNGGCGIAGVSSPALDEVSKAVTARLVYVTEGAKTTDEVREVLVEAYGSRVDEMVTAMHYIRVWDPELQEWVVVCYSASQFEVDFGDGGTIVVDSRDTRLVEK